MNLKPLLCVGCEHCKKWFSKTNGLAYYCDLKECERDEEGDANGRSENLRE